MPARWFRGRQGRYPTGDERYPGNPDAVAGPETTCGRMLVEAFTGCCRMLVRVLPFGLARWVAPHVLGFAMINGFTFADG
jgi:hypothetical protein